RKQQGADRFRRYIAHEDCRGAGAVIASRLLWGGALSARIIDGKAAAAALRSRLAEQFWDIQRTRQLVPCLAVVLVGDDPASAVYVAGKNNAARELGFAVRDIRRPANLVEPELLGIVAELNADSGVHGILVQMPLPESIRMREVIGMIAPAKDVDGLTPLNLGRLMIGE